MKYIRFIEEIVLEFRVAIENLTSKDFCESIWFSKFPWGCCGEISELLLKYLIDNSILAKYMNRVYNTQWHAWLEYNGYIRDVTAE